MCLLSTATLLIIKFTNNKKELHQCAKQHIEERCSGKKKQTSELRVHSGSHYRENSSQIMIKGSAQRVAFQVLCMHRTGLLYAPAFRSRLQIGTKEQKSFHMAHRLITDRPLFSIPQSHKLGYQYRTFVHKTVFYKLFYVRTAHPHYKKISQSCVERRTPSFATFINEAPPQDRCNIFV